MSLTEAAGVEPIHPPTGPTALTVTEAADAIAAGELSPVELTEAYLDRIEAVDPAIGAYVTVTADRARADARRATGELAAGMHRGWLHGIATATATRGRTAAPSSAPTCSSCSPHRRCPAGTSRRPSRCTGPTRRPSASPSPTSRCW